MDYQDFGLEKDKKLPPTHNIKQLGFSGLRGFSSHTSVLVGGQERSPKTQPFHIVKRCMQSKTVLFILIKWQAL
jgi:hypothetical protein